MILFIYHTLLKSFNFCTFFFFFNMKQSIWQYQKPTVKYYKNYRVL